MEKVADKDPFFRGCTSLHLAAVSGNLEMCRLILENVNDVKPEKTNVIIPSETVIDIVPPSSNQLSEIFQVPKVPEVSVHDTKIYRCLYCGENFMRRKHLKNHIKGVHEC